MTPYEEEQSQGYNKRTTCSFTNFSSSKNLNYLKHSDDFSSNSFSFLKTLWGFSDDFLRNLGWPSLDFIRTFRTF